MAAMPQIPKRISEEDYLAFERESEIKHEYVDGEIFAMAGASNEHILICSYTGASLIAALGDKPCTVYQSDLRIKVSLFHSYRYPDVTVVCGEPKFADDKFDTLTNPTILIEVLSPSTEKDDRITKLREYRQIESLQEYILISQDSPRIERYLRQSGGNWLYSDISGLESSIVLPSIDVSLKFADVYRKVSFPSE